MAAELIMIQDEVSEQIIACVSKLARQNSADTITVRDVLKDLKITNRVFYNRFHNIDEVLEILYRDMVHKVRQSLAQPWQDGMDFFEYVHKVAAQTLILSYTHKENLSQFIFEVDSASDTNFQWWDQEIKKLISIGQEQKLVRKDLDADMLSYSVWCFIRGFNADAMARNLTREEAETRFRYGFGIILDGLKA